MPSVNLRTQKPLLDIASYGRRGPGHRPALTSEAIAHASRTARGVPEVVVKVSGGARTARGAGTSLAYLEKHSDLETDERTILAGKGLGPKLLKGWDLDLEERRRHTDRRIAAGRRPPKLVHNLVFSMPKGTSPDKLRKAVRKFAVEKFALQHRYVMAMHTHQGNPHVHMVVKAMNEQGTRLNIRKATLREWRQDFARYLREFGVEANATECAVRGSQHQNRKSGIYRAAARRDSSFTRERAISVAKELSGGRLSTEVDRQRLLQTRAEVERGWHAFADAAAREGRSDVADQVRRFVRRMPPIGIDRDLLAHQLLERARLNAIARDNSELSR